MGLWLLEPQQLYCAHEVMFRTHSCAVDGSKDKKGVWDINKTVREATIEALELLYAEFSYVREKYILHLFKPLSLRFLWVSEFTS